MLYHITSYTIGMTSAISVRLDAETLRALAQLEATGLRRSEAIRQAILDSAARLQRRAALAAEVAALEADEDDRREMLEVAAVMEIMRAAG
jgi:Arc/MetJ-type ribon-helix-helix transcriptional regulator